tara:strand:- start:691 stop:975 length:285 start_codon:yes stop_codon:yes gene_type:complete
VLKNKMSLWNNVKSWFSSEEPNKVKNKVNIAEVFLKVCESNGCGSKPIEQTNAVQLFEQWYEGSGSEEDVLNSMPSFMEEHPGVNAKFTRFFKR